MTRSKASVSPSTTRRVEGSGEDDDAGPLGERVGELGPQGVGDMGGAEQAGAPRRPRRRGRPARPGRRGGRRRRRSVRPARRAGPRAGSPRGGGTRGWCGGSSGSSWRSPRWAVAAASGSGVQRAAGRRSRAGRTTSKRPQKGWCPGAPPATMARWVDAATGSATSRSSPRCRRPPSTGCSTGGRASARERSVRSRPRSSSWTGSRRRCGSRGGPCSSTSCSTRPDASGTR